MFEASVDPWTRPAVVLRELNAPRRNSLQWLHGFVSGDPSVAVAGTPLPVPARLGRFATRPLVDSARAAAAVFREHPDKILTRSPVRRAFVWLARATGWRQTGLLADACGVTPNAIYKIARSVDPEVVARAAVCLGDDRLLLRTPAPAWM